MNQTSVLTVGGICGAILAAVGVIVVLAKVVRFVFELARRAATFFDQWFGDKEAGVLSMPERMATTAQTLSQVAEQMTQQGHRLDEHLQWHAPAPNGGNRRSGVPSRHGEPAG
jgi:hypothetical protein